VFRSSDHGATWSQVLSGIGPGRLWRVSDGTVLGVSSEANLFTTPGLYRLAADGSHVTWLRWNQPVASALQRTNGTLIVSEIEGLDGWGGPPLRVAAPHLFETQTGTLLATPGGYCYPALDPPVTCLSGDGVYRLAPGGARWIQAGVQREPVAALALRGDTLFVGSGSGIHHAASGAWEPTGWLFGGVNDLLLSSEEHLLVASNETGLHSLPYGYSSNPCFHVCEVSAIEATSAGALLAAVTRRFYSSDIGILRGDSLEGAWAHVLEDVGSVRALSAGPGGFVLAGTHGESWSGPPGVGVYRSLDDGQTWAPAVAGLTNPQVHSVLADTAASYAGTENGVFRSADRGASWAPDGLAGHTVHALVASPVGVLAGTSSGLFARTGAGWQPYGSGLDGRAVLSILVQPDGAGVFIALGTDLGVYANRVLVTVEAEAGASPDASGLQLDAPRPNPAVGSVEVAFVLPAPGPARLVVRDVLGREVALLASGRHAPGRHVVTWRPGGLAAGVYLLELEADGERMSRAVTVAR
jgi:hypothetical protein